SGTRSADTRQILPTQHSTAKPHNELHSETITKQHHIRKILLIGMRANTCVDTTARFGQELGYHVTLIRDAIASFGWEEMTATFELNAPLYAHAILTTDEFVDIVNRRSGNGSP
ncbi:isochorismatase family protein, partial [Streptomyces sp. NPDC093060]|uniref:isochorismatase family protein n=1 Tax=Streptomyces sp. NPDC093060 TaxID=3366019 RepID=UPI003820CF00